MKLLLGDSHVRAFCETDCIIPIFLGAGNYHNFLHNENVENIARKVDALLQSRLDISEIIFSFNTDHRFAAKLEKTKLERENLIKDAVSRAADFISKLQNKYQHIKFIFLAPCPSFNSSNANEIDCWKFTYQRYQQIFSKKKLVFCDWLENMDSGKGYLNYENSLDGIHLGYLCVKQIVEKLYGDSTTSAISGTPWNYQHHFDEKITESMSIPGGVNISDLKVSQYEENEIQALSRQRALQNELLIYLDNILTSELGSHYDLLEFSSGEPLLFSLKGKNDYWSVLFDEVSLLRADLLGKLYNTQHSGNHLFSSDFSWNNPLDIVVLNNCGKLNKKSLTDIFDSFSPEQRFLFLDLNLKKIEKICGHIGISNSKFIKFGRYSILLINFKIGAKTQFLNFYRRLILKIRLVAQSF